MRLPPLYAVLDAPAAAARGWPLPDLARRVLDGGARLLQVRAAGASGATLLELCDRIVALARPHGAVVIVNDRADAARLSGAAGVHVGQDDLSPSAVRGLLGPGAIVGLSTHTAEQIAAAGAPAVSYVAIGPIFGTRTKDTGYEPVGLGLVREAARRWPDRPIVAIGGIDLARAPQILEAGAASVAVISDLLSTGDPEARTRAYVAALRRLRE